MRRIYSALRHATALALVLTVPAIVTAQDASELRILVLQGENATHNIRRKAVSPTLVEVRDERNRPVSGATVRFALPERGPGGAFPGGDHVFIASTDTRGQAALPGFVPNEQEGAFSVAVLASYSGREGQTFINQQNALIGQSVMAAPPAPAVKKSGKGRLVLILAAGAAAAAVGILAVNSKGGAASGAPPTTVGGGGISVGGPR